MNISAKSCTYNSLPNLEITLEKSCMAMPLRSLFTSLIISTIYSSYINRFRDKLTWLVYSGVCLWQESYSWPHFDNNYIFKLISNFFFFFFLGLPFLHPKCF